MYYVIENYSLTYDYLDNTDERFIKFINNYINMKPFIWNELTKKIFYNRFITYVKDTTFIITVYEIKTNYLKIIFELFKELLREGFITKIIYKKEFIIIHLYSLIVTKVLSEKNYWLISITYEKIKEINPRVKFFLNVCYESLSKKMILDGVIIENNIPKIAFITNSKMLNEINIFKKIFLYIFDTNEFLSLDENIITLKFDYNLKKYKDILYLNLKKLENA